jgi:uncharacterized protein with GYD domain
MAKYLIQVSYTPEGAKGLLKEGGTKRRAAAEATAQAVGGRLEAFYFTFGETDTFAVIDGVDAASAAAISLTLAASGAARPRTTVLLSPEDVDEACRKSVSYRAPGS